MNKLVKVAPSRINPRHVPNLIAVESVTPEGHPYTWATIIKNKHGRVNLSRVGSCGRSFLAGGKNSADVQKYARTLPQDTETQVFIHRGRVEQV